ncbi:hypothetical protein AAY473_020039 [Plecturocebus cupreus]
MCYGTQLIFIILVEMGFHHIGQAGLELLTSREVQMQAQPPPPSTPYIASSMADRVSVGSVSLSPRLECNGVISAHRNLCLPGSNTILYSFRDGVSLCLLGWRAVAQSQLTTALNSWTQAILLPWPPEWDLTVLASLVLNSWAQGISHVVSLGAGIRGVSLHAGPLLVFIQTGGFQALSFPLLLRLGCSGTIMVHCSLNLPGSGDPSASASWRRGFVMLPRLVSKSWAQAICLPRLFKVLGLQVMECVDVISAHCNLFLLDSSYSHASASQVVGITSMGHHAQLIFVFLVEAGFHHVAQAGLELTSDDLPTSGSQSAGITGVSHLAWLKRSTLDRVVTESLPEQGTHEKTPGSFQASSDSSDIHKQGLSLLPWLECNGMIIAHCSHKLLGSSEPPTPASQVAGTTGAYHYNYLSFDFFVEMGSRYVAQAGLKLLGSSDPLALDYQSAEITGMSH